MKKENTIWVECPKCSKPGKVTVLSYGSFSLDYNGLKIPMNKVVFNCLSCNHRIQNFTADNKPKFTWYTGYDYCLPNGNICSACGVEGKLNIPKEIKPKDKKCLISCSGCNNEREYAVQALEKEWTKIGVDEYFGLPLLFQKSIKGNLFWILNEEHLFFLKDYLERKIRKTNTIHNNPENRIPSFIISAKNKDDILSYITKCERFLNEMR